MLAVLMSSRETSLPIFVPMRGHGDNHQGSHGFCDHVVDYEAVHNMVPLPLQSLPALLCLLSEDRPGGCI